MRIDGRKHNEMRPVHISVHTNKYAEGSALIEVGDTKVMCTATVEDRVPVFMKGQGKGWVTAEYSMLPRATHARNQREATRGKLSGRTMEIQRFIGRAIRSAVNLRALGERTFILDCDVIQADGGTRTAAVTGSFVALILAIDHVAKQHKFRTLPITDFIAAVSVGIIDNQPRLDLNYYEDSKAKVDMNIVMTASQKLVELQGTGEDQPFYRQELDQLLELGEHGISQMMQQQKQALANIKLNLDLSSLGDK